MHIQEFHSHPNGTMVPKWDAVEEYEDASWYAEVLQNPT